MKESQLKRLVKNIVKECLESKNSLKEDHGLGFGHNVSLPQDDNTMNKSPLNEYSTPKSRKAAITSSDYDRGAHLLFVWSNESIINYKEFEELLADFVAKIVKKVNK